MNEQSPPPEHQASLLAELVELIDRHGWAMRYVLPGPPPNDVGFSYTVGLTALGHPEIVIMGMPQHPAQQFLNLVGAAVEAGGSFEHGTLTGQFTDGPPVLFIRAVATGGLTAVGQLYGHVTAVQLVWPDSRGHLPGHPDYHNPPGVQPLLGPVP